MIPFEKVASNRKVYYPTRDERTCPESHILVCTKFWFVSDAFEKYSLESEYFGWIDVPFSKSYHQYKQGMITNIINECKTNPSRSKKFNINILNAVDKQYKLFKREYYQQYRWLVCGNVFITHITIGLKILDRLKSIFIETTIWDSDTQKRCFI